jgi:hypothetical protein
MRNPQIHPRGRPEASRFITSSGSRYRRNGSRLASRVSRERALTQPRRSHTEKPKPMSHYWPHDFSCQKNKKPDVCITEKAALPCASGAALRAADGGRTGERPAPADTRVAAASSVVVAATFRAHAPLDHPSRGSAQVDPCSPCNPWLKIGWLRFVAADALPPKAEATRVPPRRQQSL